jgi:cell division protein FtsB
MRILRSKFARLRRNLIKIPSFQFHTGGWFSVVIVVVVATLLVVNLWGVAVNAKESFDVYVFEQESLAELRDTKASLEKEKEYYESYEYQRLYARDNLRLAESGETLYQIITPFDYFEVDDAVPDLVSDEVYLEWWLELLWGLW